MKSFAVFPLLIALNFLTSCGCTRSNDMTSPPVQPINYIVLLDLSDRLLTPAQSATDTALIQVVFDTFKSQVAQKGLYISSKDRFQIVVAPQQGIDYIPALYMDQLSLNLATVSVGKKKIEVEKLELRLKPTLQKLYGVATHNRTQPAHFAGSDLWRYFNEHLSSALVAGADNRLVILTDGYLDFNDPSHVIRKGNLSTSTNQLLSGLRQLPDWQRQIENGGWGILPIGKKFSDLSVAVVEINPKNQHLRESEILRKLWQKWLADMGVVRQDTIQHFSIANSRTKLGLFLH